jgi:hypothetical protein
MLVKKCARCPARFSGKGRRCGECREKAATEVRLREAERFLAGLCTRCDKPPEEGSRLCAGHIAKNKQRCSAWVAKNGRKKYQLLRKLGMCVKTANHGPATHGSLCKKCRMEMRASQRVRRSDIVPGNYTEKRHAA